SGERAPEPRGWQSRGEGSLTRGRPEPPPAPRRARGRPRSDGPAAHAGEPDPRGGAARRFALRPAEDDETPRDPHRRGAARGAGSHGVGASERDVVVAN